MKKSIQVLSDVLIAVAVIVLFCLVVKDIGRALDIEFKMQDDLVEQYRGQK